MNKATVGTGATGLGGAITIVLLWALKLSPPPEVIVALQTVISAVIAFPAIWFTPHKQGP